MHSRRRATTSYLDNVSIFDAPLTSNLTFKGTGSITVPTISDSNGDRWGFNGSVWTETDAEQPRFYDGALYMEGSHTELSGYSGDISNFTTVSASASQDAVGLRGSSNEAFTLTDNSAAAIQFATNDTAISDDSDDYYCVARLPYLASQTVYPRIRFILTGGTDIVIVTAA